jgi:RluA family pseudouridine synthase
MKRNVPYRIVHEDDSLLVVDKAAGIAVLADRWDDSRERLDEILNEMFAAEVAVGKAERIPFPHRVFVVHRIDRDTSGLVAFAKTAEAHRFFSTAFEARGVDKSYIAVIHGRPAWTETSCDLPLRPDGDREHRTVVDKALGKRSVTRFRVLGGVSNLSLVECRPETGRTHQIRVHLATLGYPIVCDPLYGTDKPVLLSSFKRGWRGDPYDERPLLSRLGLHAARLVLPAMGTESANTDAPLAPLELSAPLARDMAALINQMEKSEGESFGLGDLLS